MKKKQIIICGAGVITQAEKWTAIALTGEWKGHVSGEFKLTLADLEQIVMNFNNANGKDVVVDFEHQSITNEKAEATGWAIELRVAEDSELGDVLQAKINWLDETKKLIKSKKYKYLSPVLLRNAIDPISGENIGWALQSIALTNTPFFQELNEVIINKRHPSDDPSHQKKENILDEELKKKIEDLENKNKDLVAEIATLKEEATKLKKTNAEAKVDEAVAAKKIQPDQKDSMLAFSAADPEGFDAFLKNAKTITQAPGGDDMFAGSQTGGQGDKKPKYDVLKIVGIE